MSSPETLNSKLVANELSFPLVTQTTYSNERFDSYGILNSGHGAEDLCYDDGPTGTTPVVAHRTGVSAWPTRR
jgi:hypothetical protein